MTAVILNLVLTLLLASHLLCVNLAMTGPLACAALRFRAARRDDTLADHVGRRLVKVCQISLLIAIGLGLFSSWLMWEFGQRQFFDALGRLPARRIYWGLAELAFYFLCMSLYGMLWDRLRGRPVLHASIAVVAATNLMYHFPPLFVIIGQLAAGAPGREAIDTSQLRQLMVEPAVLARLAHHLMASLTITAVAVMIGAQRMTDTRGAGEANSGVMRGSALVALTATLLQLPIGLTVLLQLNSPQRAQLLGGQWLATGLFVAALVAAVGLLHWLCLIALGQRGWRDVVIAAMLLATVTGLMTGTLRETRRQKASDVLDQQDQQMVRSARGSSRLDAASSAPVRPAGTP